MAIILDLHVCFLQTHNISSMQERVIGVSHHSCLSVIFMTLLEGTLSMTHASLKLRLLFARFWITGLMTQRRRLVMLDLRTKEQHVTWILFFRLSTIFLTLERSKCVSCFPKSLWIMSILNRWKYLIFGMLTSGCVPYANNWKWHALRKHSFGVTELIL